MLHDLSHVRGGETPPLLESTIGAYFDEVCASHPDVLALVSRHQNIRWTYRELKAEVDAFATGLLALGLQPGDRVGIWAPNCAEWIVVQFATAKAGLILVNVNPAYRLADAEYALNKVECRALVLAVRYKTSAYLEMLQALRAAGSLPHLEWAITIGPEDAEGCLRFSDVARKGGPKERDALNMIGAQLPNTAPINIQFTSGTTGFPKGATLSHRNILNNGFFVAERIGLQAGEGLCIPVPLYHCFGMVMGVLGCLTHAATMVLPSDGFEPRATLEAVAQERCTALYGVPTMFIAMLSHPDFQQFDLHSLRTGIMAGSPCPIEVMRRVVADMHMPQVTIAYGMTETSPVSFQSSVEDSLERRVSTVGRIQPHLEVKLVDAEGRTVPRGDPGEIWTRGYSVMLGYWGDPERTAETVTDGWMHTGDLGVLDDEGFCNIVGRIKDMVIRGGENIYPREVEEFLYRHPDVSDVQVVGVPDVRYGEELCAWVVLKPGATLHEDALREYCRGRIAHYKVPRYVRFVEAFPTTVTGKVQKFAIREQMIAELELTACPTA